MQKDFYNSDFLGEILKNNGKCPICNRDILVNNSDNQVLKSRVISFKNNGIYAKCQCKNFIKIPLEMVKGLEYMVKIYGQECKLKL